METADGVRIEDATEPEERSLARLPAREEPRELTVPELKAQVAKVLEIMRDVMQDGLHYGVIQGTDKPTLLKPGAEKLQLTFRAVPKYQRVRTDYPGGHREYEITCGLYHSGSGALLGQGLGSCSTLEAKYRWRQEKRKCPHCGQAAIIKGKEEFGGGWLCWRKASPPGCGAKFADGDAVIEEQPTGRIENPDLADTYNTVLKMATKRAQVAACLTAFAVSDIFTQDLEEQADVEPEPARPAKAPTKPGDVRNASKPEPVKAAEPAKAAPDRAAVLNEMGTVLNEEYRGKKTFSPNAVKAHKADLMQLSQMSVASKWTEAQTMEKLRVKLEGLKEVAVERRRQIDREVEAAQAQEPVSAPEKPEAAQGTVQDADPAKVAEIF